MPARIPRESWPDLYRAGQTFREIAHVAGVDEKTVRRYVTRVGARPRARGARRQPVDTMDIIFLRESAGLSWRMVAREVGLVQSACQRRYHKARGCTCRGFGSGRCAYCHTHLEPERGY